MSNKIKYARLNGHGYEFGHLEETARVMSQSKKTGGKEEIVRVYAKLGVLPTLEEALTANGMALSGRANQPGVKA